MIIHKQDIQDGIPKYEIITKNSNQSLLSLMKPLIKMISIDYSLYLKMTSTECISVTHDCYFQHQNLQI